jgi:hypothetical protein
MTTDEAIKHFGGIKELARLVDIWPHAISRWGEYPPILRQYQIAHLSGHMLKVTHCPVEEVGGDGSN